MFTLKNTIKWTDTSSAYNSTQQIGQGSMSNFKKIISNGLCLRTLNGSGMQKMDPEPASKVEIIRNMSSEMHCFAFVPTISRPNQNVLLSFR
jgi:hypothetical protein